jgi:hypothetical protein
MNISTATFNPNPILGIHGMPGSGKSTTASKAPKPVAILAERGLPLVARSTPLMTSKPSKVSWRR